MGALVSHPPAPHQPCDCEQRLAWGQGEPPKPRRAPDTLFYASDPGDNFTRSASSGERCVPGSAARSRAPAPKAGTAGTSILLLPQQRGSWVQAGAEGTWRSRGTRTGGARCPRCVPLAGPWIGGGCNRAVHGRPRIDGEVDNWRLAGCAWLMPRDGRRSVSEPRPCLIFPPPGQEGCAGGLPSPSIPTPAPIYLQSFSLFLMPGDLLALQLGDGGSSKGRLTAN